MACTGSTGTDHEPAPGDADDGERFAMHLGKQTRGKLKSLDITALNRLDAESHLGRAG